MTRCPHALHASLHRAKQHLGTWRTEADKVQHPLSDTRCRNDPCRNDLGGRSSLFAAFDDDETITKERAHTRRKGQVRIGEKVGNDPVVWTKRRSCSRHRNCDCDDHVHTDTSTSRVIAPWL